MYRNKNDMMKIENIEYLHFELFLAFHRQKKHTWQSKIPLHISGCVLEND